MPHTSHTPPVTDACIFLPHNVIDCQDKVLGSSCSKQQHDMGYTRHALFSLCQVAVMETVGKHPRMRFLEDKEVDDLVAEIEAEKGALEASRRDRQTAGQPTPEPT